jgi:quinone-modifying oxidoreductase subunit QmoC
MIWAQWGLKERLLADGDVWLCEQCNECSTQCPRGARPGDVLAALRGYGLRHFAWPGWLGQALSQPRYLALLFAVPLLIGLILAQPSGPEGEFDVQFLADSQGQFMPFEKFVSHGAIYGIFITLTAFIALSVIISVQRFWKALSVRSPALVVPPSGGQGPHGPTTNPAPLWPSVVSALKEILTHQQLRQCETSRPRYVAHLLIFYGFIGLLLMNVVVVLGLYGFGWKLPWAMDHPVKILAKVVGNLSGLAVVVGCLLAIAQRVRSPHFALRTSHFALRTAYWDWLFVILLCAVAATGLVVEVSRLLTTGAAPYQGLCSLCRAMNG